MPRIRYLITYAIFGELATAFGDAQTADVVYSAMLPYADLFVCGGAGLTMVEGSVQRYLGLTLFVLGRLDEAVRWLRGAVAGERARGPGGVRGAGHAGTGPGAGPAGAIARRLRRWLVAAAWANGSGCCRWSGTRGAVLRWGAARPGR